MIEIDGSLGEGGGQVLRSSLTLAALTQQAFHISNIRANRTKPGLRPQHLAAVRAAADICNAEVQGATEDAMQLTFQPQKIRNGRFRFPIDTAGAASLVFQTVFLPLAFAAGTSELTLTGGTHVPWSPSYHYLEMQWLPLLQQLGFRAKLQLNAAGFYPRGGGEVKALVLPAGDVAPLIWRQRGKLLRLRGICGIANLEAHIAKRQKLLALQRLEPLCRDTKIQIDDLPATGQGTFLLLKADFADAGSACYIALGERGKRAEKVADEVIDQLLAFLQSEACMDEYLADQLLLPLAFSRGTSEFTTQRITQHLLTNAAVLQQFLDARITIQGKLGEAGLILLTPALNNL